MTGIGGIGKTQIAVTYSYRFISGYDAVFWVSSDSETTIAASFGRIGELLHLRREADENSTEIRNAVLLWLASNSRWLIIFDNADNPSILAPYLPRSTDGHIIVTSRAKVFDSIGVASPIRIGPLGVKSSVEFLIKRVGRTVLAQVELDAAKQLATSLGHLPLALEQAGAFIHAKDASFSDYLYSYSRRPITVLEKQRPIAGKYEKTVATTWEMNYAALIDNPAALDLLRLSAFLAPDQIPLELFQGNASCLSQPLANAFAACRDEPLVVYELIDPLTTYSLVSREIAERTFSVHRLVQLVTLESLEAVERRFWAEASICIVASICPVSMFANRAAIDRLLPHVVACASAAAELKIASRPAIVLLNMGGRYVSARGEILFAESLFNQARELINIMEGECKDLYASTVSGLATTYRLQGQLDKSEECALEALRLRQEIFGDHDYNTIRSMNGLGECYAAQGRHAEAEHWFRTVLATLAAFRPDSRTRAYTLRCLANTLIQAGRYEEAETTLQSAKAILDQYGQSQQPQMASVYESLGDIYAKLGETLVARDYYQSAVEIREKCFGPNTYHSRVILEKSQLVTDYSNG